VRRSEIMNYIYGTAVNALLSSSRPYSLYSVAERTKYGINNTVLEIIQRPRTGILHMY
jgi:hypothetical protein